MAMPRLKLPVAEIVARYVGGESTAALARAYGTCGKTIWNRLQEAGIKMRPWPGWRRPGGPLWLAGQGRYLSTRDRQGRSTYIHRGCWEAYYGPIPRGMLIHHLNGNSVDSARIENLQLMSRGEHLKLPRQSYRRRSKSA